MSEWIQEPLFEVVEEIIEEVIVEEVYDDYDYLGGYYEGDYGMYDAW